MLEKLASKRSGEFIRFVAVGGASALINTLVIVALTETLRIDYLISYAVCFVCVTLFGFTVNRSWSFRIDGPAGSREIGRYFLTTATATIAAMVFSWALVKYGVPYPAAVFLSAGIVAPINFITHRSFSFALPWRS